MVISTAIQACKTGYVEALYRLLLFFLEIKQWTRANALESNAVSYHKTALNTLMYHIFPQIFLVLPVLHRSSGLSFSPIFDIFASKLRWYYHLSKFITFWYCQLQDLFKDPVIAADGFTYERSAIEDWLSRKNTSPLLNVPLEHTFLIPNHAVRTTILRMNERTAAGLL